MSGIKLEHNDLISRSPVYCWTFKKYAKNDVRNYGLYLEKEKNTLAFYCNTVSY